MMRLSAPPDTDGSSMSDYYRRCSEEGAVFRGRIGKQSFELADDFDPAWGTAAVCWCAGGTEHYRFPGRPTVRLKAGAVLTIGASQRYAYSANSDRPFVSSMIAFPSAMTRSLGGGPPSGVGKRARSLPALSTRVFRPERGLMARLNAMAGVSALDDVDPGRLEEQATLLAAELMIIEDREARRPNRLVSAKASTRRRSIRRLRRATELIHDRYDDRALDLAALAREACIAKHHFVRVFSAAFGSTPLRYLRAVRMEAAARLLETMDLSSAEVAAAVGFGSRPAFQRRFRLHFGVTPAAYRAGSRPPADS